MLRLRSSSKCLLTIYEVNYSIWWQQLRQIMLYSKHADVSCCLCRRIVTVTLFYFDPDREREVGGQTKVWESDRNTGIGLYDLFLCTICVKQGDLLMCVCGWVLGMQKAFTSQLCICGCSARLILIPWERVGACVFVCVWQREIYAQLSALPLFV